MGKLLEIVWSTSVLGVLGADTHDVQVGLRERLLLGSLGFSDNLMRRHDGKGV